MERASFRSPSHLKFSVGKGNNCTSFYLIFIMFQIKETAKKAAKVPLSLEWMGIIILSLIISSGRTEYRENLILSEECTPWELENIY